MRQPISISDNGRLLLAQDGEPFFYLGDTAWELFHRLDRDEATLYLNTRAAQGFNVIQAVVLAEFDGLRTPNRYGEVPLENMDPATPNEAYFEHVDWVIQQAAERELCTALLPTWGDKVNRKQGVGPEVFDAENAYVYGRWLGQRYRDMPMIWVLGGDRSLDTPGHLAVYQAMARGLREGDGGAHLMTFHPPGSHSSSHYVHAESWLDFNMIQSGHSRRDKPNWDMVGFDRQRQPIKPTLDAEPCYEDHPVMSWDWKAQAGEWFDQWDVRKAAWRALLAGACGHTYGCHGVWQMLDPERQPAVNRARTPWKQAIRLPGAEQMQHVRSFFEAWPWRDLMPDDSLLGDQVGEGSGRRVAARSVQNDWALFYLPTGGDLRITTGKPHDGPLSLTWYDPRTGESTPPQTVRPDTTASAPTSGEANDWLAVVKVG